MPTSLVDVSWRIGVRAGTSETTMPTSDGRGIGSSARVMLRLTLRDDDDESDGASDLRFEDVECGLTDLFALTREFERARAAVVANESTTTGATTTTTTGGGGGGDA
jgi:hypothetical protein